MTTSKRPSPDSWLASGARARDENRAIEAKRSTRPQNSIGAADGFHNAEAVFPPQSTSNIRLEHSLAHLSRANYTRLERARIKRELKQGTLTLDVLLVERPPTITRVPVFEILQWAPWIGRSTALKLIAGTITESLPLASLGASSQARLLAKLKTKTGVRS